MDARMDVKACKQIHQEIGQYSLFNSDFDFFGIIYESFANKELKKDFGEFYTPRHVIQFMVSTLLKNESYPRDIAFCDPACGTGGFLVEAFLYLKGRYEEAKLLDESALTRLRENVFIGYDTNDRVAIPYARTNMMMAGDGGTKIQSTQDSLLEDLDGRFDYILANIPYGLYSGSAKIENFTFSNSKRFELMFLEKCVNALKPGGRAAIIVPDSVVEATSYSGVRQNFLFSAELEAVISLPPFIFEPYTTEKTYILYFKRKMPSEIGQLQKNSIWHGIVDFDGFAKGKKRYPIVEDDFPEIQSEFMKGSKDSKFGFIPVSSLSKDNFYNLSSEYHLRRPMPLELDRLEFESLISQLEKLL
ncbi:MAG: SAM-dependent methyltransferase [Alphaproteobacteria bacterium]|nr:SAM-dependent methyltransferase [Alphaproteobacteria bacterium]